MNFFEFLQSSQSVKEPVEMKSSDRKKEMSNNLRLVLLAIRLQRLVKRLPPHLVSAERISRQSLSEQYLAAKLSHTAEGALKMAGRDLTYLEKIFGLEGNEHNGYVMKRRFEHYVDMFRFWLACLGKPSNSNRRMHILITGLIRSIENGFRNDPIIIPELAQELKQKFGSKNIRDAKEPLLELFSNDTIASYLLLLEEDDILRIDRSSDPLLMRLKTREEVGDNIDISINLAMPGRVRSVVDQHLAGINPEAAKKTKQIAVAVQQSHAWQDQLGNMVVPYILYREGEDGPVILTIWNASDGLYRDIPINQIDSIPTPCSSRFIPYQMPERLWEQFIQITA